MWSFLGQESGAPSVLDTAPTLTMGPQIVVHSTTREVDRETRLAFFLGNGAFRGDTQSTTGTITGRGALDKGKGAHENDLVL